jgi:hypothetical protein
VAFHPLIFARRNKRTLLLALAAITLALSVSINVVLLLSRRAAMSARKIDVRPDVTAPAVPKSSSGKETAAASRFESKADFAKYGMKLHDQALLEIEPQTFVPTSSRPAIQRFPWKTNIVTTVFWIGEKQNYKSVWDENWTNNYGGFDNPESSARRNYIPVAFVPRQNPFYCALPYNDVTHSQFKPEAPLVIPWFKQAYMGQGQSVCWHHWISIRKGNRTCYAQWEDCGPFRTDHFQYVFGNERPTPNPNHGAGLNVSPAVRDYLGLAPTDVTDWQFVNTQDVPPGPWRSYGDNNHFVIAHRQAQQQLQQGARGTSSPAQNTATPR